MIRRTKVKGYLRKKPHCRKKVRVRGYSRKK